MNRSDIIIAASTLADKDLRNHWLEAGRKDPIDTEDAYTWEAQKVFDKYYDIRLVEVEQSFIEKERTRVARTIVKTVGRTEARNIASALIAIDSGLGLELRETLEKFLIREEFTKTMETP